MSIIKYTITFLAGVYIGQEYQDTIPKIKNYTVKFYDKFTRTEFYREVSKDMNKKS